MTPTYKLSLGESDIRERLTLLVAVDRAGFSGDTLMLQLHAENVAIPRRGVEIACEIGYEETGTWSLGSFVVEDVKLKGPPHVMTLLCVSHPQGEASVASLQTTKRERAWQSHAVAGTTFADVVSEVVSEAGLTARIDNRLAAIKMPAVQQTNESDAAFLHRLTVERNGIVKINAGIIIFETRDQGRLGQLDIVYDDQAMSYAFDFTERYNISAVRAKYQDVEMGSVQQVTVGSGKGVKILPKMFPDYDTALFAAETVLKHFQRNYISAKVKIPTPALRRDEGALAAEKLINLSGFPGGSDTNRQYVCVQVKHIYQRSSRGGGLISELALKRPQQLVVPQPFSTQGLGVRLSN